MEQKHKLTEVGSDVGDVKVHNNAIKAITELTLARVKGVIGISRGSFKKMLDTFGVGKAFGALDGIRVETDDLGIKISLDVVAAYGFDIPEVASKIQEQVKQAVESMTGISSIEVDVNVVSVEQEGSVK